MSSTRTQPVSAGADSPAVESAVRDRYGRAAREREPDLCCAVDYDRRLLEAIPREVLERDYGCGDPSRHLAPGDTVLDLGSGGGKVAFLAAQIVGSSGRVIGIDMNDAMLELARGAAPEVARRIGFANVEFRKGRIQDLALDLEALAAWLERHPVRTPEDLTRLEEECERLRRERPLVEDASVDVVISNCVLNLVRDADKAQLVSEIFRVLRPGGRIAISDIVSDEPVPAHLKADPELWTGCVSGAFHEREFLEAFERAGFQGLALSEWRHEPFRVVEGIEFRSVTLTGYKPETGPCLDGRHAVIYRGPWRQVEDDEGHVLRRGVRTAVCTRSYARLTSAPYREQVIGIAPREAESEGELPPFDCARTEPRHPRETKGWDDRANRAEASGCCGPEASSCCDPEASSKTETEAGR